MGQGWLGACKLDKFTIGRAVPRTGAESARASFDKFTLDLLDLSFIKSHEHLSLTHWERQFAMHSTD